MTEKDKEVPPADGFTNLMDTLLANLSFLKEKLEINGKTTHSLLSKASSLKVDEHVEKHRDESADRELEQFPIASKSSSPLAEPSSSPRLHLLSQSSPRHSSPRQSSPRQISSAHFSASSPPREPTPLDQSASRTTPNSVRSSSPSPSPSRDDTSPADKRDASPADREEIKRLSQREAELLRVIAYLDTENQTLSDTAEAFQATLEVAIKKYRTESEQSYINKNSAAYFKNLYEAEKAVNEHLRHENLMLKRKMEQMISVMQTAIKEEDQMYFEQDSYAVQLESENENLRNILQIAQQMSTV